MSKKLAIFYDKIYKEMLENPSASDYEIAQKFHVSRGMIWNIRQKYIKRLDYQIVQNLGGKFLSEFQQATDYFKMQIERLNHRKDQLESLLTEQKTVFKTNLEGVKYPELVELEPRDKAEIIKLINDTEKQQSDLWKNIINFARQGEAVEVMRLMQTGRIKLTNQ